MIASISLGELMDQATDKLNFGRLQLVLAAIAIVTASQIDAQSQQDAVTAPPAFEVASIRPVARPYPSGGGARTLDHGRFRAQLGWVRAVIGFAYNVLPPVKVHGGPTWIDTDLYDFEAKAEAADAGPEQMRAMMQTLLTDRFKLAVHREAQEAQVYTLVVGKNGPKMEEAKGEQKTYISFTGSGQIVFTKCNLLGLIGVLSSSLQSPVLDQTGLKGFYNFNLEFVDPRIQQKARDLGQPPPADSRPDLFSALQEQLGLKLEAKKGPVEILLVDHIERPSEN